MVMIDVGANDGLFTIFAARRVGKKGHVFAFEPSAREFARLQANIRLNRLRNVKAIPKAVSDVTGASQLKISEYGHEGQNTLGDFVHAVKQAGIQVVEVCRLDEFLQTENLTRLDVMKIDVEGAEYKVLQGGEGIIRRFRPIILLELLDKALQHQGDSAAQVLKFLLSLDYKIYDFSPDSGQLVPSDFRTHSDNVVASPHDLGEG
jgi:FkbM family methyltransferase